MGNEEKPKPPQSEAHIEKSQIIGRGKKGIEDLMAKNEAAAAAVAARTGKDPKNVTVQEAMEDLRSLDQQAKKPS
ncbi:hypothetical protein A3D78_04010 [Candidatus Gottesmanbacteria bacterium RIFCSPHIGHO2_02_FULL_39_14]|uniref:Uncharacterized protein n=1 Tax=Candidatus Gottesmanbacteria bacterium RIFCSPHIGHO2_02_FULL_39_14 TaxID=1798383 RepID=A0A1F5ZY31_9BACT|nr:MAG: hypothetical protein A3D78_04010 [Candidatus Gottesmanbacteria bacterium RIFCSPHIGHO2_02_FULL_39_14]